MPRQKIYIPPNPDIERLMKQLLHTNVGLISTKKIKPFTSHKVIREIRPKIIIAKDPIKKVDIVKLDGVRLKKQRDKEFIFF